MSKKETSGYRPKADKTIAIRMDADSLKILNKLSHEWQVSRGEVIRRLLKQSAQKTHL